MKKKIAKIEDFFVPVGDECLVSSYAEATYNFASNGIYGEIQLGLITDIQNKDFGVISWAIIEEDKVNIIPAFEIDTKLLKSKMQFKQMSAGEMFLIYRNGYIVVDNPDFGLTIKSISIYNREYYARGEAYILEYENLYFKLCKLFAISNKREKFITVAWVGYNEEEHSIIIISAFKDDITKLQNYDVNEIDRIALDVGDSFCRNGEIWEVGEDEHGLLMLRVSQHLRVVKREEA